MIKYLKQSEIDYEKWDSCIANSSNSYIYAYSWYLDIVAQDWDALIEGDYEYVFPLPFKKKFGISYIYQPTLTQQLGVFSNKKIDSKTVLKFIQAIPNKFKLTEINLNKFNHLEENKDFNIINNTNIELDISKDYESLWSGYSKNLKRNIKKGIKNNLSIGRSSKPEDVVSLFSNNKGTEISAFSKDEYRIILQLMYVLINKDFAEVYSVFSEHNNLLAGIFILNDKARRILIFSGLNSEGKEKGAMPFLINSFIKENINKNLIFDFEGSNNPTLARFFKSFGANEFHYQSLRYYQFSAMAKMALKFAGKKIN